MITLHEVREFGMRFFDAVAGGASAAEQAHFFLDPHARIYVAWNGATINLKEHETLHAQWINEHHSFRPFRSHGAQYISGPRSRERHRLLAGGVR